MLKELDEPRKRLKALRGEFEISIFIEGISAKDTIRVSQANKFVYNTSQAEDIFNYIGEANIDENLRDFVFKRFNELRKIRENILATGAQWAAGLNPIFMLSDKDRQKLLGLLPPSDVSPQELKYPKTGKLFPSSLDWRDKDGQNWMTEVKSQGGCGSCWAFAAVGHIEALINVAENDTSIDLDLAEQTLVTDCCTWCGSCNGGWHDAGLHYTRDTGIPLESCDPYTASNGPCDRCLDWQSQARKITSYNQVTGGWYNENDIKNALINHPLSTTVWVDNGWWSYSGGIYSYTPSPDEILNHAIVFVGWNDDSTYWIIKNSWGKWWGENGYMRIEKGKCNLGYYTYNAEYAPLFVDAGNDTSIYYGDTITLDPTVTNGAPNYAESPPGYTYLWSSEFDLPDSNIKNPKVSPPITTTYTLKASDLNVSKSDSVKVTVLEGCYVACFNPLIDDDSIGASSGNGDGIVNEGEIIEMSLWVKNYGTNTAHNVEGKISTTDTFITVIDSLETFGTIEPGDSLKTPPYIFEVDSVAPDSHLVTFNLTCQDILGSIWVSNFNILVRHFSTISGRATDATGLGIPDAIVICTGPSFGIDTTDVCGYYTIVNLPGGAYTLIASASEFLNSNPVYASVPPDTEIDFVLRAPDIKVLPESLQAVLKVNDTTSQIIIINNFGNDTLEFRITESNLPATGDNKYGSGGPDSASYSWIDSDELGGPTYDWIDITKTGTEIIGLGDDSNIGPLPIGFTFPFYGNEFTSFRFCTNGWVSFTSTAAHFNNTTLPNTSAPFNLLAPFWDDLDFSAGGNAYYYSDEDKLIVEYYNVSQASGEGPYTFEIILAADGVITYQYQLMRTLTCLPRSDKRSGTEPAKQVDKATLGIQNEDGTIGLQVAYNTPYVHDNLVIKISKDKMKWLSEDPISGTIPPEDSIDILISYDASGLTLDSTYYAWLKINSNDPDEPIVSVPVTLTTTSQGETPVIDSINPQSPCTTQIDSSILLTVYAHAPNPEDSLTYKWSIDTTASGSTYLYSSHEKTVDTVKVIVSDGILNDSTQWIIIVETGIEEKPPSLPRVFAIHQNVPNPFTKTTEIRYQIPDLRQKNITVSLKIYDITGTLIRTLVNESQKPNYYKVIWNGHNEIGKRVPAGIYFYRMKAGNFIQIKKAIRIK
ncbi:carboxypeptidase regulatory-like domain-containing protein [candidate division WOR-3 bacterium]|nr:carboxypeptidase regulatory-like domain-containing protein [candidate division WOR-3 bacterium]